MIDTLRILVSWTCNMRCPYCCNEQERFRSQIRPVHLEEIDFSRYQTVCITGGEPLLRPSKGPASGCASTRRTFTATAFSPPFPISNSAFGSSTIATGKMKSVSC